MIEQAEIEKIKKSGIRLEDLEAERAVLQKRKERIDSGYTAATTATTAGERELTEQQKQQDKQKLFTNIMNVDLGEASKYIKFGSGSGS